MFVTTDRARRRPLIVGLLLLASCATAGSSTDEAPSGERPAGASRSSQTLAREELATVSELNALQAVERLRPAWLRRRGAVSLENQQWLGIRLYVDGNPGGYTADLEQYLVSDLEEMRFMNSRDATMRFGTGYPDGAIVISTRRR